MANLPVNKNCLCNYNARDYNPATGTIPKTAGQLFNEDLVLSSPVTAYTDASISIDGQYMDYDFGSGENNIFARDGQDPLTIVAKISKGLDNSGEHSIFSCRDASKIDYLLFNPGNGCANNIVYLLNASPLYTDCPYVELDTEPNIFAIRIDQGMGYGQSYTDGETFRSITNNYEGLASQIGFFDDSIYGSGFESWRGEFYWLYISNEALTDNEIAEVIAYNEESDSFYADPDSLSFDYQSSTSSITLNAEIGVSWTATSVPSWITLSNSAGTGTATITVSAAQNNTISPRTSTIVFSNGEDTAEVECTQAKHPIIVPFNNIYRNGLIN